MPKNGKREARKRPIWRGPCLTAGCLLLLLGIAAGLVWKGLLGTEQIRAAVLLCCLAAGAVGALLGRRGEGEVLLNAGLPSVLLLAAGLAGGENVEMGKPLLAVLLMLLPSVPALLGGKRRTSFGRRRGRRTRKAG